MSAIIDYTNHRGERAMRRIVPVDIMHCPNGTEFHSAPGWYLRAYDLDKKGGREFAMADIHSWQNAEPGAPVTNGTRATPGEQ